jgi:DNA-binding NarL/FixJ family response regulator
VAALDVNGQVEKARLRAGGATRAKECIVKEVLVVEDHPLVAEATAGLIVKTFPDVEVCTASTSLDALQLAAQCPAR